MRWRGTLGDPNELALALGAIMPFAFAFASASRKKRTSALCVGVVALLLATVVLTGSRGGQLVVLTVFGVYFVRRYGWKGAILAAVFAFRCCSSVGAQAKRPSRRRSSGSTCSTRAWT